MPIPVKCKCGKQFAAKDELAGKAVRCPQCKQPLKIPQPQAGPAARAPSAGSGAVPASGVVSLFDEVGFHVHEDDAAQHCPACDAKLSDHAIICVACGYDLESGKRLKGTGLVATEKSEGHEGAAQRLLHKAEHSIKQEKIEQRKTEKEGMPLWMIVTALVIVLTFAGTMSMLPRREALIISGGTWLGICILVSTIYNIMILVVAFQENATQGLLCMFVPMYQLFYVITRWAACKNYFLVSVGAGLLSMGGWGLLVWGLNTEPEVEDPDEFSRWSRPETTLVVADGQAMEAPLVTPA
jgi:hypothetical protein